MDFDDFDDDSFFVDEEGFKNDANLTIVEEAKLNLAQAIQKNSGELIENIRYNETTAASLSFNTLLRHIENYAKLESLENNDASDEELEKQIDEIMKSTTEITLANMDAVLNGEKTVKLPTKEQLELAFEEEKDEDDGATDF